MLARKSGIVCGPVVGDNHVWNYVIIDGVEYMIDVTWDDVRDEKHRHDYFMLTPEEMARDHPISKDYAKYNPNLAKGAKRTYANSGK